MDVGRVTATLALILVFVALVAWAAWLLHRTPRREPPEFEELRRAVAELERDIGAAFEPVLSQLAERLERWSRRS
jgi:hypothetical protein